MKLSEYVDRDKLSQYVEEGFINLRQHPAIPSLFIYNYSPKAQFSNFWPHEVCACRGLIVDADDNIIARPMYKFFNLGQRSTILGSILDPREVNDNVDVNSEFLLQVADRYKRPLTITRKMDGMMGVLWHYGDQWGISTRGSFQSEGAVFATEKWNRLFVKYGAAQDFVPEGWTLIFEIVAKHLRIVVPYAWEGLVLLTAVNNETGEEMAYENLYDLWQRLNSYSKTKDKATGELVPGKPWCRIVERVDSDLEACKTDPSIDEEGYVVSVNRPGLPPVKAKIKLAEYLRLHKILTGITPQMVWDNLAHPMHEFVGHEAKFDYAQGMVTYQQPVPQDFKRWVEGWQRGLTEAFHQKLVRALQLAEHLRNEEREFNRRLTPFEHDKERKEWMANFIAVPRDGVGASEREMAGFAMQLYRGQITEAYESIWKSVRPFGKDETFYHEGQGE